MCCTITIALCVCIYSILHLYNNNILVQGCQTYSPRAKSSPPEGLSGPQNDLVYRENINCKSSIKVTAVSNLSTGSHTVLVPNAAILFYMFISVKITFFKEKSGHRG